MCIRDRLEGAGAVPLIDKGEVVVVFHHPVGRVGGIAAAVGVVVVDDDLFAVRGAAGKVHEVHPHCFMLHLGIQVGHPGGGFLHRIVFIGIGGVGCFDRGGFGVVGVGICLLYTSRCV